MPRTVLSARAGEHSQAGDTAHIWLSVKDMFFCSTVPCHDLSRDLFGAQQGGRAAGPTFRRLRANLMELNSSIAFEAKGLMTKAQKKAGIPLACTTMAGLKTTRSEQQPA